jgi:hypothetical protein
MPILNQISECLWLHYASTVLNGWNTERFDRGFDYVSHVRNTEIKTITTGQSAEGKYLNSRTAKTFVFRIGLECIYSIFVLFNANGLYPLIT